jgi:SAM-dependent methyltransferase
MTSAPSQAVANSAAAGSESPASAANPNRALWEKGDFTRLAATMRESGDEVIDSLGVTPAMDVLGVDIASNLVAAGNARAAAAGLANLRFEQGDASALAAIADERFDLLVSMFGAMFAPRPLDTAREMVRVTRPGGRIMMGNWIPGDPTLIARVLQICAAYTPPPPEGFVSPVTWGKEEVVRERFGAAGIAQDRITCERATYTFRFPGAPREFLAIFRDYYGPTMNAFAAAAASGRRDALEAELLALFEAENRAPGAGTEIPATFLRVIVTR